MLARLVVRSPELVGRPVTQILLRIDSDMQPPELLRVDLLAYREGDRAHPSATGSYNLENRNYSLPARSASSRRTPTTRGV